MRRTTGIFTAAVLVWMIAPADAQSRRDREDRENGPALGVARVSVADGDVRLLRPSGADFQARASTALVEGDRLTTGADSKAEIQFNIGNFLRLSSDTEVLILGLGNKRFQMEVVRGVASYSQLRRAKADVEIETRQAIVFPLKRGVYVVEAPEVDRTVVTVRKGKAEVETDRGLEKLDDGLLVVRGDDGEASVQMAKAEPRDQFDDWNKRRDKILQPDGGRRTWFGGPLWWGPYFGYGWGYPRGFYGGVNTVYVGGRGGARRGRRR